MMQMSARDTCSPYGSRMTCASPTINEIVPVALGLWIGLGAMV